MSGEELKMFKMCEHLVSESEDVGVVLRSDIVCIVHIAVAEKVLTRGGRVHGTILEKGSLV